MVATLPDLLMTDPGGVKAQLARDNLIAFTRLMFPQYRAADHHWRIAHALQGIEAGDIDRLVITMPPRHGKSELASVHFPAWFLGRNPDRRVIATSYGFDLARKFSRRARNLFREPRWPFAASTAGDLSAVDAWDIADHRGGYVAAGVGGGITGMGADLLMVDDPVKDSQEADSETYRERAWEWFTQVALTRLEPGAAVILIGTRWHEDDLIGRALTMPGSSWTHLNFPAQAEEGDQLGRPPGAWLWPGRFTPKEYEDAKGRGSRAWTSLYQQRPSPAEGGTFKRHWWRYWSYSGQPLPPVPLRMADGSMHLAPCVELPPFWDEHLQSWDMAFKDTKGSDYVAGQVWGAWRADRFLLDQTLAQLDFPATLAAVRELTDRWPKARRKLVEDKANGPAVIATLRHELPGLVAVEPDGGKEARANAATPEVESGNVYLPHPRLAPWVDAFVEECASFPDGKHDDQVDAMTQALLRMASGTGSVTTSQSYVPNPDDDDDHDRRWH